MRVFITGGAGFIGSHLADRLIADGAEVLILDNLSTGSIANVDHLIGNPRFKHRIGSVEDAPLVAELVDRCDVTIHLAAAVGVKLIVREPVRTIETNVHGTEVVLEAVSRKNKPIVIASTSEVYGKSTKIPFHEDDDLVLGPTRNSRWAYACSKALDEWLALAYAREKGVPVVIARFFNTVGPRQTGRYGMVIPTFVTQALLGEPITVFGDGRQSRCFGHVKDAVEAVVRLMGEPRALGEAFNIGTDQEVTMNELAERVRDAAGSNSSIVHVPYDEAYTEGFEDMRRRVPDLSKLESIVDFRPSTSLDEIIADVVAEKARALPVDGIGGVDADPAIRSAEA
jgi:UDP-glucose 4-epimerase